jgi:hypothetical protein
MIGDTHVPQQSIVGEHPGPELDDLGLVLVMEISLHEAFVQFDDLP